MGALEHYAKNLLLKLFFELRENICEIAMNLKIKSNIKSFVVILFRLNGNLSPIPYSFKPKH